MWRDKTLENLIKVLKNIDPASYQVIDDVDQK